jgi:SAM-dependent methyltransferase
MVYHGTILNRLFGLQWLFEKTAGKTVLDIGCSAGLISYEFAKAGTKFITGIDYNNADIHTANQVMEQTGLKYNIYQANITTEYKNLNPADIVLYLGMHHHIKNQVGFTQANTIFKRITGLARQYLAVRTTEFYDIDRIAEYAGLDCIRAAPRQKNGIGKLKIYQK